MYPTTIAMDYPSGGNQSYTGSITDLQSADGNCVVLHSDTTGKGVAGHRLHEFTSATGYSRSQIMGATVEYPVHDQTMRATRFSRPNWDRPSCTIYPLPSQLTTYEWTYNALQALDTSGNDGADDLQLPRHYQ